MPVTASPSDEVRFEVKSLLEVLKDLGDYTREDAEGILDEVYGEDDR